MADNVTLPANTGTFNAATEDVGGYHHQKVIPTKEPHASFRGRSQTFRTAGAAGTAGQKLLSLFNGAASGVDVHVNQITIDLYQTVIKAITVAPPTIRVHRLTAAPTGGSALAKVSKDSALSSAAAVALLQATSSDGGIASAIAATIAAGTMLTQEYAPRFITAVGYEPFDRATFLDEVDVVLHPGEGLVLNLDYTVATQNPATDIWIAGIDWAEFA